MKLLQSDELGTVIISLFTEEKKEARRSEATRPQSLTLVSENHRLAWPATDVYVWTHTIRYYSSKGLDNLPVMVVLGTTTKGAFLRCV